MVHLPAGALGPFQPKSSIVTVFLLVVVACVFSVTNGFDSGLLNGLNIMPQYKADLKLTTVTKSLNTASTFIGWGVASSFMGPVVNIIGRKSSILGALSVKLVGIALMAAAQNVPMFVCGRILLGMGKGTSAIASSSWLAETLPAHLRGRGLSLTWSLGFIGSLIASCITFGTANLASSWSWRIPCLLQSVFSIICGIALFFVPESPRWLIYQDRQEEALLVMASVYANGDTGSQVVTEHYQEILDTLKWEQESGQKLSYVQMFRTPNARRRVILVISVALIATMSGNNIISYYLGTMLTQAGIPNSKTQLEINMVLSAWSLICALIGCSLMEKAGRKTMCLIACILTTIFLFLVGALTSLYGTGSDNTSGIYGTVASIFLFQGAYAVGITPITVLYPSEILNYSIRTNGMALWVLVVEATGVLVTFVFPFALEAISWKLYMINGAYNALQAIFVYFFWVETRGMTLEHIDRLFGGLQASEEDVAGEKLSIDGVDANTTAIGIGKEGEAKSRKG